MTGNGHPLRKPPSEDYDERWLWGTGWKQATPSEVDHTWRSCGNRFLNAVCGERGENRG